MTLRGETDRRDRPQALQRRLGDGQRINERRAAILDHGVGITFGVDAVVQDEPPPDSRDYFLLCAGLLALGSDITASCVGPAATESTHGSAGCRDDKVWSMYFTFCLRHPIGCSRGTVYCCGYIDTVVGHDATTLGVDLLPALSTSALQAGN